MRFFKKKETPLPEPIILEVGPDDVLLFMFDKRLSYEQYEDLKRRAQSVFSDTPPKVLIIEGDVKVLRRAR